ncbi:hypothetical protein [Helicobacter sp. 23-1045]
MKCDGFWGFFVLDSAILGFLCQILRFWDFFVLDSAILCFFVSDSATRTKIAESSADFTKNHISIAEVEQIFPLPCGGGLRGWVK